MAMLSRLNVCQCASVTVPLPVPLPVSLPLSVQLLDCLLTTITSGCQCYNHHYYCKYHFHSFPLQNHCLCHCHCHCRWSIVNWLPLPQLVKAFRASARIPSEKNQSENASCTQSYWFPFFLCQFVICCNQSYGSPFFWQFVFPAPNHIVFMSICNFLYLEPNHIYDL